MKGFDDHLDNYGNPGAGSEETATMYEGEIWDGPGDNYLPGDDEDYEAYDLCTRCGKPVYWNGSSPETLLLMHSDYPADGHDPEVLGTNPA